MKPDLFKVDLSYPVVFVSGQIRTGKVILVKLLSTLPKFEKPLMSAIFEQIFTLKHINQISNTVSNYLITKFLNSLHYNQAIGRDLNLRTNEITSLKEYQKPERYLAKAKQKNAYSTFRKSLKENFTIPFLIHNGILEAQLLLSAKKNSKLIEIFKNPFDLVISWKKKKYQGPFYKKPNSEILCIRSKGKVYPYFLNDNKILDKLKKKNDYEKLCEIIYFIEKKKLDIYKKLPRNVKKKILILNFEDLLNFKIFKKKIENFLKVKTNTNTYKIYLKEKKKKRKISSQSKIIIKKKVNKSIFDKLCLLEKEIINLKN